MSRMLAPPGYREVSLIGAGATSRVFRAISAKTGQAVALKRLHRQLIQNQDALSRLRREFEALSKLRHPDIVRVRDVIRWQGDPTVVMDFIPGQDLKERIQRDGPLSTEQTEQIARALLNVLIAAHGAGIVHRDIKPQNIRLSDSGRVFLLDFGSARLEASSQLTATGTSVGTPDYMAPELFAGSVYDPRADIYGLGATLYECLTGRAPQIADSLTELAYRRTQEDAPPVTSLRADTPASLAQMIDRCLRRAPDTRYPTANLALWALDHPQLEKSFQYRQSLHPPCLRCAEAIPEESAVCPSCGNDHPFNYSAGSTHLDLVSVKEPQTFMAQMLGRFPELASSEGLEALSQRLGALDTRKQRMISFIDRDEAAHLQEELASSGIQTEVVQDPGSSRFRLHGFGLLLLLASVLVTLAVSLNAELSMQGTLLFLFGTTATALITGRLAAVGKAQQGMLSYGRYPAAIAPTARATVTAGAITAGALGALAPTIAATLVAMPYAATASLAKLLLELQLPAIFGASALGVSSLSLWLARFKKAKTKLVGSPEPGLGAKLSKAFSLPKALAKRMNTQMAVMLTSAVLLLVPVELVGMSMARSSIPTFWSLWVKASDASTPAAVGLSDLVSVQDDLPVWSDKPVPNVQLDPDGNLADMSTGVGVPDNPDAPASVRSTPPAWKVFLKRLNPLQIGLSAGFLLLAMGVLLAVRRKSRRLREHADGIFAGLTHHTLLEGTSAPITRRAGRQLQLPDQVAQQDSSDPFVRSARRRVTELAHCLPAEDTHRLDQALAALDTSERDPSAERSMLARCILEADAEQRLRFEFLALEGQMEALAAQRWAASLRELDPTQSAEPPAPQTEPTS